MMRGATLGGLPSTRMRRPRNTASSMVCVTTRVVTPVSSRSSTVSRWRSSRVTASSEENGSSISSRLGCCSRLRAMAALALAAAELARVLVALVRDAQAGQPRVHIRGRDIPPGIRPGRGPSSPSRGRNGPAAWAAPHSPTPSPRAGGRNPAGPALVGPRPGHGMAVHEDPAGFRLAQARDEVEQRALAAARWPDQRPRLARGHRPRKAVEHGQPVAIGEVQVEHLDHRRCGHVVLALLGPGGRWPNRSIAGYALRTASTRGMPTSAPRSAWNEFRECPRQRWAGPR